MFLDLKKAFDTLHRDVMIDRCKQLEVRGQFLETLVLLPIVTRCSSRFASGVRLGECLTLMLAQSKVVS